MAIDLATASRSPARTSATLGTWLGALRVPQWTKNVLIFVPLTLGHRWSELAVLVSTACAFMLLLAVTSATYLINDVLDRESDRAHPSKRHRAIASGLLPVGHALAFAATVLPLALIAGFLLDAVLGLLLLIYVLASAGYSLVLKSVPLLDTLTIAMLITLRIAMGSSLIDTSPPVWLLTFSVLLFYSLATAKRHVEIVQGGGRQAGALASRGYEPSDWPLTLALGVSAGIASLVVLALYLVDEAYRAVGYSHPELLWPVVIATGIWVGRIWLLTHRGRMDDDPVSFALRDRVSYAIGAVAAVFFMLAL